MKPTETGRFRHVLVYIYRSTLDIQNEFLSTHFTTYRNEEEQNRPNKLYHDERRKMKEHIDNVTGSVSLEIENVEMFSEANNSTIQEKQELGTQYFAHVILEHTYAVINGRNPKKGKQKKVKCSEIDTQDMLLPYEYMVSGVQQFDGQLIENYLEIETSENNSLVIYDPLQNHFHISKYEMFIRQRPKSFCASCDRFLFDNQVQKLTNKTVNKFMIDAGIDEKSSLCFSCYSSLSASKIPMWSILNDFQICAIPVQLSQLSKLEKKTNCKNTNFHDYDYSSRGAICRKGDGIKFTKKYK